MTKNTNRNRNRNIWAKRSRGVYSVKIVADISGRSAPAIIPENVEIYQNGALFYTDTFYVTAYGRDEIVATVRADAEKIANRLNESHTYLDSAGVLNFFNAVV